MEKNGLGSRYSLTDAEYIRMREAEDSSYEYHGADAEEIDEANADDGYPEVMEHNKSGSVYDLKTDFIVLLPGEIIRIPQDSNLAWMTMFYALPRELVEKRPAYLELPRNITQLFASEKHMKLIGEDAFLELVWDCYAWAIWQAIQVPDGKGSYKEVPGSWQNFSGDFPIWRLSYDILRYFRMSYETEMEWSFQRLFTMPQNASLPWLDWRHFSNLVFNLTDRIVAQRKLQPIIDEVWNHRQPEDYTGYNLKRGEFLRKWNHSRYYQHTSVEKLLDDEIDVPDTQMAFDRKVLSEQLVEQFEATLSKKDKTILDLRMKGRTLQEIADIVDYETPSAVSKRIDKNAEQYEAFINPLPEGAERVKPEKKRLLNFSKNFCIQEKTAFLKPMNIEGGNDPSPTITAIGSTGGFFACRKMPLDSDGWKEVKNRMSTQMEKLLATQEKTQEKLRRAQEEEKQLKKRIAELKRNERTHRLCTRGGYVEKLLAELGAPELSDEEVFGHLQYALNTPYAKTHLANLLETKRKAAAETAGTEAGNLAD